MSRRTAADVAQRIEAQGARALEDARKLYTQAGELLRFQADEHDAAQLYHETKAIEHANLADVAHETAAGHDAKVDAIVNVQS
jgi:hypothetical protein